MATHKTAPWLVALAAALWTTPAFAQSSAPGTLPVMGSYGANTGQVIGGGQDQPQIPDCDSGVSFIDSAVPWTQVKARFDANYVDHRPTRGEVLFSKSGTPGNPGWWFPERNVDWQELSSYIEIAYGNDFSGFLEIPTRWVNPDVNPNDWGLADINFGGKWAFIHTAGLSLAAQLRGTFPSRAGPGLSTSHYAVEPGLLFYLRPISWLAVEGELRYNFPISGTDYAGQYTRYGLGFSFGERSYEDFWITPVIELVGWTMTGGQEMVVFPDGSTGVHGASGETIVNGVAGIRFGVGDQGDVYLGYGRGMTGDRWQQDFWRVEFRVRF